MTANNQSMKRRLEDREESVLMNDSKRYFDLNIQFSPSMPAPEPMPSITFASPDYRPPPPAKVPLWLQPTPTVSVEDDSEDEPGLLTPLQDTKSYWNHHDPMVTST